MALSEAKSWLLAIARLGRIQGSRPLLDNFYYDAEFLVNSGLMRPDGHQPDWLFLHCAGLAAHLCLRPAKLRGVLQAANDNWRALFTAVSPAHWPGVALSKASQWLLDKFRLGRVPGSRPFLDKFYYGAMLRGKKLSAYPEA